MSLFACIVKDCPVKLWGLSCRQRVLRVLQNAGVTDIIEDIGTLPDNVPVLLLRGDFLFDDRVINYLVQNPGILLKVGQAATGVFVAAHVASGHAGAALAILMGTPTGKSLPGVRTETLESLGLSFRQRLLKFEPPFVLPVSPENRRILEKRLFDWSYKGVTDLVTKWAWPHPARWAVAQCVRFGLRPNHVTMLGLLLVVLSGVFFAGGRYGWGLLAGWSMTFLDTVDGKLARVTVTSSKIGHYFDHLIDLIHPPIWYVLWGLGLTRFEVAGLSLATTCWLIVVGYLAGRLAEGVFLVRLGKFGLFCWRPIDSYCRLITARRNPCLILLTAGVLLRQPDWGLAAVAIWTVVSSVFLLCRMGMALLEQKTAGTVRSWLADIDLARQNHPLAVRLFTRRSE